MGIEETCCYPVGNCTLAKAVKSFPMQGGPPIPWDLAENIYQVYTALYGSDQTLEILAKRGGFGWAEVVVLNGQYRKRFGKTPLGWSYS